MKYYLATYGCQMNEYDSAMIASMLEDVGYYETENAEDADVILVNTCSVRKKAEDNIYARISQLKPLKQSNPDLRIAVLGCMAENHGAKITDTLKHVDFVVGPDQYRGLVDILALPPSKSPHRQQPKSVLVGFDSAENYDDNFAKILSPFSTHITIQRGCNKRCAYCIVPFTRGIEKFRPVESILAEVQKAVDKGVKEISLLGQTVNSYRYEGNSFANLLSKVAEIKGVERLRFTSPHPRHYTDELLWVLTHTPQISPHTHLPLQSGSNDILKSMRRQYDSEDFLAIVEYLRASDPFYGVTTDIIVGFTGETEEDYLQTLEVVKHAQFDHAFMFAYSPREGTEAFDWPDSISEAEKHRRLQKLIDLQNEITRQRSQNMIGREEKVLIERPSPKNPEEWMGKTGNFKNVALPADFSPQAGDIVTAKITEVRGWTLRGEAINL